MKKINVEINEQTIDTFFVFVVIILNVAIEKRNDFDAMIEREIISIQNIDFFNVAIDVQINVTNKKNYR